MFKDKVIDVDIFKAIIQKKYKIEDYTPLYIKIINYQIDKYGCQLYDFKEDLLKGKRVR